MNNFTFDMAAKSKNLNSNSKLRLYKHYLMLKFTKINSIERKLTQTEISKQLGFSDSFIKRYRDDISMDSPYNRNNYKKKTTKRKTNTNLTSTQDQPKLENSKFTTNRKTKKNLLEGGKPNNEPALQNDEANSNLENNQEDNTKFINIARRMVDNIEDSHSLKGSK